MDLKELSTKEKIPDELFEELLALENQMLTEMDLDDVEQLSLIYKFLVEYYAINEDDPKYQYYIYKLQDLLINKSNIKSLQRRRTRKTLKKNQNETQNPESKPSSQSQSELPQQEDKEIKSQRRRTTIKKKLNESKANPMKIREYIKNSDLSYNSGVRMLENSVRTQKNKFLQNYQLKKMKIYNYKSQQIREDLTRTRCLSYDVYFLSQSQLTSRVKMKLDFSPIKKFKINNKVEELPDYVDDFVEKVKNSTLMKAEKLQTMVMLILQNEYSQKVAKHKFLEVKTEELNLFKTFEENESSLRSLDLMLRNLNIEFTKDLNTRWIERKNEINRYIHEFSDERNVMNDKTIEIVDDYRAKLLNVFK